MSANRHRPAILPAVIPFLSFFSFMVCMLPLGVHADEWTWAEQLIEGEPLPAFSVMDTAGSPATVSDVAGERGTLLFFSRSTDW